MKALCCCFSLTEISLHIENRRIQKCKSLKTDFLAPHFIQVLLSVASLLFEIKFSKSSRNKIMVNNYSESKLSKKFNFTYKSKCMDLKNAIKQLTLLQMNLVHENELNILTSEVKQIPLDDVTEISISMVFELIDPEKLDEIVQQFDVFTAYLDSVCEI